MSAQARAYAEAQALAQPQMAYGVGDTPPLPPGACAYAEPFSHAGEETSRREALGNMEDPDFALALQLQREEEAAVAREEQQVRVGERVKV